MSETLSPQEIRTLRIELDALVRDALVDRRYEAAMGSAIGQIAALVESRAGTLAWTRTKPTVPGIYRWRITDIGGGWTNLGGVGEVVITMDGPRLDKFFVTKGEARHSDNPPNPNEWSGPIALPVEPKP